MSKQLVNFITCGCESSAPFFTKPGSNPRRIGDTAFSTTKTGRHDIAELLLKVALQFTTQSYIHINMYLKAEKVDPAARLMGC
jgi:hypothetical protein